VGQDKPAFKFAAAEWAAIRDQLAPIAGNALTRHERSARSRLEDAAAAFLTLENIAARRRHQRGQKWTFDDAALTTSRLVVMLKAMPILGGEELIGPLADLATKANIFAAMSRHSNSGRFKRRDFYLAIALTVWEQSGGEPRTSGSGDGGPLIRYLLAAANPVLRDCGHGPLTVGAARGAVRKILAQRKRLAMRN
jgi:hypothetical protein